MASREKIKERQRRVNCKRWYERLEAKQQREAARASVERAFGRDVTAGVDPQSMKGSRSVDVLKDNDLVRHLDRVGRKQMRPMDVALLVGLLGS